MANMAPVDLPYLQIYRSRGKAYAYYRRAGRQVRIAGRPGEEGFAASYEVARVAWQGTEPAKRSTSGVEPGSIRALIDAYKAAPDYRRLAAKTQRDYATVLDMLAERFGAALVRDTSRPWVVRLRNERQDRPRSANYRVAIIGALFKFAIDAGLATENPAGRIGKLEAGEGYRPWTEAELAAMTGEDAGDVALPVLIGRYTSQRQGDVLRLPWSAYDGAGITLRQRKGRRHNHTDAPLWIPVPDELRAVLDATPRTGLLICLTKEGRPWKPDWFRHRFAQVRDAAALPPDLHYHGLRATRLTELAESGASEHEIMANSGHKSPSMVQRYTRAARQKNLAQAAVARLQKRETNTGTV